MSKKLLFAVAFFVVAVLVLTRLDWVVHYRLYSYGLIFSYDWAMEYWFLYGGLYQLVIIALAYFCGSWRFFFATEAFVLSDTQDLIYFGLWLGDFPANNINWWWMKWHDLFGSWNTANQFALCLAVNGLVLGVFGFQRLFWKRRFYGSLNEQKLLEVKN